MDEIAIKGVILTPLKQIFHPKGNILHAMKKSDSGFNSFGEAYFSTIIAGETKGWKKHLRMTMNLIVPAGEIRFVIYDDRPGSDSNRSFLEVVLSGDNYQRLTVPPGVWMGFQGVGQGLNLLLNLADMEHDPTESQNIDLDKIPFGW